ncbi:MAG: Ig-like domain-containing protein, partial [Anaerolineales bacterium]
MKKNLKWIVLVGVVILAAVALSVFKGSKLLGSAPLSVQVTPAPSGPKVVARNPIAGQRLDLSPVIQITFDRDMNREKTSSAFSLRGPDGSPVSGKAAWRDSRTFEFAPSSPLIPSSSYTGVFSTSAAALDGASPADNIQLDFMTAESLQVAQVFPTADAENIDGTTNITVIFNHPVVPLTIQEEQ